ncbi:MAG: hypothetical protein OIF57_02095 [Marinobacterium sp.]|nr:hypothetical protein [Marinobacterium sp.]
MGYITFWSDNDGKGDQVGQTLEVGKDYTIDCRKGALGFRDNRIRSVRLKGVPCFTSIALFDKSDGDYARYDYNWVKISVDEDMGKDEEVVIDTLNENAYGPNGKVRLEIMRPEFNQDLGYIIGAHRLDGHVSFIQVGYAKLVPVTDPEILAMLDDHW